MKPKILKKSNGRATIKCTFCHGKGTDPFEVMSKLSRCSICHGKGEVMIQEPFAPCAYCHGTGVHRDSRMSCLVCHGKGVVHIDRSSNTCELCGGTGRQPGEYLPCLMCKGKGFLVPGEIVAKRKIKSTDKTKKLGKSDRLKLMKKRATFVKRET